MTKKRTRKNNILENKEDEVRNNKNKEEEWIDTAGEDEEVYKSVLVEIEEES